MNLYFIIKRAIDVVGSLFGIIVFSPIMVAASLWIKFVSPEGPIFADIPSRVGKDRCPFNFYKFRSMIPDALAYLKARPELYAKYVENNYKLKEEDDPRIIKGGAFLRKYSIDELPQFFNVLKGDMSIVGPRPLFDDDTSTFDTKYMRRLNVLPGITGLLQINDRNTDEFETWYKYDIEYIENWSLLMDIKIILKTPYSLIKNDVKGV